MSTINFSDGTTIATAWLNEVDAAVFEGSMLPAVTVSAGGTAGNGVKVSTLTNFGIFFGSGAPSLAAYKGSLYLRTDGSGTTDRVYVNTNGSTTWTAITTVA
jgi:hypothetical protein